MVKRRYPIGAEIIHNRGVHFRIWAPDHKKAWVVLQDSKDRDQQFHAMKKEKNGYFSCLIAEAKEGSLYKFQLGSAKNVFSDPASRYQPYGPANVSCVINPNYRWTDTKWPGLNWPGQIIYEMHIGTFTKEGTYEAAMQQLEELAQLGITAIEIMPVNEFPGHFGWGYDGVNLFAPYHQYGKPKDLKAFVNKAHNLGLGVILDVVYNHLGPEGNQMIKFSKEYFNRKCETEWGKAVNFDLPSSREFFITNARYWIEEYHFDGLRIDATPWFFSSTPKHILAELTEVARKAGGKKRIIMIGENEKQDTRLIRSYQEEGYAFDGLWNDDFHHTSIVRLTGKREAYYIDYLGSPQEFISSLKHGFLYQGQYYVWQNKKRGTPYLTLNPASMIHFLENHDQVANTLYGKRLKSFSDFGNYKAITAFLLLSLNTPMLFQGQEFGSSKPFLYFADYSELLNTQIRKGRREFLSQFPSLDTIETKQALPNPSDPLTFALCKLDFSEREKNASTYQLHIDLIHLRKNDSVFRKMHTLNFDGAVLSQDAFLIRYFCPQEGDRLLLFNFGLELHLNPSPEPLLVPNLHKEWELLWSSEAITYEGGGMPEFMVPYWKLPGHCTFVLKEKKAI